MMYEVTTTAAPRIIADQPTSLVRRKESYPGLSSTRAIRGGEAIAIATNISGVRVRRRALVVFIGLYTSGTGPDLTARHRRSIER
jgi:hypothetical protein